MNHSEIDAIARQALLVTGGVTAFVFWTDGTAVTMGAIARTEGVLEELDGSDAASAARAAVAEGGTHIAEQAGRGSLVAIPIRVNDTVLGAFVVTFAADVGVSAVSATVLDLAASQVARSVRIAELEAAERTSRLARGHANRHLNLLAQGSRALGNVIDDETAALSALAATVVTDFADWCAIDLAGPDQLQRVAFAHTEAALLERVAHLLVQFPNWSAVPSRVVASGRSELVWDLRAKPIVASDSDHHSLNAGLDLQSCLIVAVRIHGLSVGSITCATSPARRGYRQSDVEAVEELAARTATALERISLYRETQRAAAESTERAGQLRRLNLAALAVQGQHRTHDVAAVLAHQAAAVLGTEHGIVTLTGTRSPIRVTAGDPEIWPAELGDFRSGPATFAASSGLGVALVDRNGTPVGVLAVAGRASREFGVEDESVLVALGQTGSVALDNVRLYESLLLGESRLLALIDAAPLAVVELDAAGDVVRTNSAALQLFGDARAPFAPRPASNAVGWHPETMDALKQVARDAMQHRHIHDFEVVARRADGTEIPVSVAAAVLRGGAGEVDGAIVLASDLTARRQLEHQLVRAQRIEAVGQVAGGVAHDFNNLLTVILGHATLLDATLPPGTHATEDVAAITMAAERAAEVTAQLLTISRGELVPTEVFDVRDRIDQLAATIRSLLPSSIDFNVTVAGAAGAVRMSPAQFDQVILNLAINGRDAMTEHGSLAIAVAIDGEAVTISVSDSGTGMDPATAARCFEPFFSTKGGERGTGLGLATVHSIVTGVGGDVHVDSTVGRGTTFTVRFPAVIPEPDQRAPAAVAGVGGSERVLLVEDQVGLRRLAIEVLRAAGYAVMAAADGQAALEVLDRSEDFPDLVVTDVVMPRMGGVELAARLRERNPALPVLFMTGYIDEASRAALEGSEILIKPFVITELARRVRAVLDDESAGASDTDQGSKR